uniref:Uncharacterized protein n=1 Tax=viral metagenome TaxID=1070528 RepID=A0A6M3L6Y0_9ZZZZ
MPDLISHFEKYVENKELEKINKRILIKFFIIFIDFFNKQGYQIVYRGKKWGLSQNTKTINTKTRL